MWALLQAVGLLAASHPQATCNINNVTGNTTGWCCICGSCESLPPRPHSGLAGLTARGDVGRRVRVQARLQHVPPLAGLDCAYKIEGEPSARPASLTPHPHLNPHPLIP